MTHTDWDQRVLAWDKHYAAGVGHIPLRMMGPKRRTGGLAVGKAPILDAV